MSASASIKQGLTAATAHAKGTQGGAAEFHPLAVERLRRRLALTQGQFAACFGFSVATLRHW